YQASLICDYIEGKWGFPAIRKMLLLYKDGRSTPEVFKGALDIELDKFDKEFLAWVDAKAAAIDVDAFKKMVTDGQKAVAANDLDKGIELLSKAVAMYPEYSDEYNPYVPLADAYLKKGDKSAAIDTLQKLMTYSETAYKQTIQLSDLLEERGDHAGARR